VSPEEIGRAHESVTRIVSAALQDDELQRVNAMLEDLGDLLYLSPASDRIDSGFAMPGGLLSYMLTAFSVAKKVASSLAPTVPASSVVKTVLFHDIGRVGDPKTRSPYYLHEDDSWKRDKLGKAYRYNDALPKMTHSSRSLYVLSHYGVPLSVEEWIAIQTAHGYGLEENRFYAGDDSPLSLIVQTSARRALLRH